MPNDQQSSDEITRALKALAASPLVSRPFLTIGLPISLAILCGTILIAAMLFLLGLPSPW